MAVVAVVVVMVVVENGILGAEGDVVGISATIAMEKATTDVTTITATDNNRAIVEGGQLVVSEITKGVALFVEYCSMALLCVCVRSGTCTTATKVEQSTISGENAYDLNRRGDGIDSASDAFWLHDSCAGSRETQRFQPHGRWWQIGTSM